MSKLGETLFASPEGIEPEDLDTEPQMDVIETPAEERREEAAEGEQSPDEAQTTQPEKSDEERFSPGLFKAMTEERDKRQAAERREEESKRELERLRQLQQRPAQPVPAPDMFDDPGAYEAWQAQRLAQIEVATRVQTSEAISRMRHGDETVNGAIKWVEQQGPRAAMLAQQALSQPDPYGFVIDQYKRDQTIAQIGDRPFEDAAREWAEKQGYRRTEPASQDGKPSPQSPPAPSRSLASTPSAGGGHQQDHGSILGGLKLGLR